MTSTNFSTLAISQTMQDTISSLNYMEMTPIQSKALPYILKNHDVLAQAKTGSGKTAAFGIGLVEKIDMDKNNIQALVLCPTRELALQVTTEIRKFARSKPNMRVLTLFGGKDVKTQAESIKNGAHIIVGTPGRVLDHIQSGNLKLGKIETLVLDEADRMLDMGFEEALEQITAKTPKQKQTLLFSATYPKDIQQISKDIQISPVEIRIKTEDEQSSIEQLFFEIKKHERNSTLIGLLQHYKPNSCLIFCNTKLQCKEIANLLKQSGFHAKSINGDLEQLRREQILIQFSNKSCSILVATDVAARGIDIDNLELVINYELSRSPETHMHRIGRTGRAGKTGTAVSLFLKSEEFRLGLIEKLQKSPVICDVPASLDLDPDYAPEPLMQTLCIKAGKKQKLRKGDLLGALTGDVGLTGDKVGKIHIGDYYSYVGIDFKSAKKACYKLANGKIKSRNFKVEIIS